MGQYHTFVNLTKKEMINPHKLGTGLKVWEHLASGMTGRALVILMCCPDRRGGGDLQECETVGRWHGDHVIMVGDYAEPDDIPGIDAEAIYKASVADDTDYTDVTDGVCAVIEAELGRWLESLNP